MPKTKQPIVDDVYDEVDGYEELAEESMSADFNLEDFDISIALDRHLKRLLTENQPTRSKIGRAHV